MSSSNGVAAAGRNGVAAGDAATEQHAEERRADAAARRAADDAEREAADAAEAEGERVAGLNKQAAAELKQGTREYARGEEAARQGKLLAGKHYHAYIRLRLAAGLKDRSVAVKAVEAQVLPLASEDVDVNRLIRCYHAHRLLVEDRGLKLDVPYGHYTDAYSLLLEQHQFGTPAETYTLLPGLERKCLDLFDAAVKAGESRKGTVEQCQALVRERAAALEAERKAKAAAAKAEADAKATAEREAKAAKDAADAEAKAKEQAAKDAEREAAKGDDADAKAKAAAAKAAAKAAAEEAREAADRRRFEQELAAREAARAKQEAREADRRQAEAEAKRRRLERRRLERRADKGDKPARRAAPVEAGGPVINPAAWADKHPEDVAEMLAGLVAKHKSPDRVWAHLVDILAAMPGKTFSGQTGASVCAAQDALRPQEKGRAAA
jgi:hypothetical protein